jgi:hypothetical protein
MGCRTVCRPRWPRRPREMNRTPIRRRRQCPPLCSPLIFRRLRRFPIPRWASRVGRSCPARPPRSLRARPSTALRAARPSPALRAARSSGPARPTPLRARGRTRRGFLLFLGALRGMPLCIRRLGVRVLGLGAIVGRVEPRSLEEHACGMKDLAQLATTYAARLQWLLREGLDDLDAVTALFADVLICGHAAEVYGRDLQDKTCRR